MNWLDIILILFLIGSMISGIRSGLISAVMGLVGIIGGIALASRFYTQLADLMGFIPQEAARILAFIIILAIVVVIAVVIAKVLTWVTKSIMLGWLNRLGGAIFGLVSGALFLGAVLAVWIHFYGMPDAIADSFLGRNLVNGFPLVLGLLPGEFNSIKQYFQ